MTAVSEFDVEEAKAMAFVGGACSEQRLAELLLAACDEIEKLRVKVEQLQKRAGEWEQKDVVAFEKTIADLREKLAAAEREAAEWAARYGTESVTECISDNDLADKMQAAMKSAAYWKSEATTLGLQLARLEERIADREDFGSRVYGSRRHWKGRAGRAERELESYAATDRTASMALADVTRERDEARADLENYQGKAPDHMYIEANEKLQADLDAANAQVGKLRGLVHQEECCEGTWDSDVDHYGCCEALRCSLGETGGDDDETSEERDDG